MMPIVRSAKQTHYRVIQPGIEFMNAHKLNQFKRDCNWDQSNCSHISANNSQ